MIHVNLLPNHLRPVKRTPVPYLLSGLVLVIVVLGMAGAWLSATAQIMAKQSDLTQLQSELEQLDGVVQDYNQLQANKQQLAVKAETIREIVSGRIIWSRVLWDLSRLAPDNFWYTTIATENRTFREQVVEVDPNTKEQVVRERPVTRPVLKIAGYALEREVGSADVSELMFRTLQDEEFARLFTLEQPQYSDTVLEGYPVKQFELAYRIRTGPDEGA